MTELVSILEASKIASDIIGKDITKSNISYLIQYGKINKHSNNGTTMVSKDEIESYYNKKKQEISNLVGDGNPYLSFANLKESDTTKHVHKLHPYKGKYIPQLVEYFIDGHTDEYKKNVYFYPNDIILDPFCGSGTTLVQANECGINAIGIDVSDFNAFLANCKLCDYDVDDIAENTNLILKRLWDYELNKTGISIFESNLDTLIRNYNKQFFSKGNSNKDVNMDSVMSMFNNDYFCLMSKRFRNDKCFKQNDDGTFLSRWYTRFVREEMDIVMDALFGIDNPLTCNIIRLILSRTIHSCRATTHYDLATLVKPQFEPYYCYKHKKICRPVYSMSKWFERHCEDTIKRLKEFSNIKTNTWQYCISGDSRTVDLNVYLNYSKINGIFTSPPYVGMIDYHEQHSYAYELFGIDRCDDKEIGPMSMGQGSAAIESYVQGISDVLNNCKKHLIDDYDVFIVANDKFNLYPTIAEKAGMEIVERFERPVLNRSERNRNDYFETIFHLKEKKL